MNERDKELAKQAWTENDWDGHVDIPKLIQLVRADERERIKAANAPEIDRINAHIKNLETAVKNERESIAQMFEDAPALVPFAQNDKGGCMICGFMPKLAMESIRARGNT
jgi:hypothetical protein